MVEKKKILKNTCVFPLPVVLYRQQRERGNRELGAARLSLKAKKEKDVSTAARAVREEKNMTNMKKYIVGYYNGESRQQPGKGCDYMICAARDEDGEPVELYAEMLEPDGLAVGDMAAWDYAIFNDLKADIIRQAKDCGIAAEQLAF